MEQEIYKGKRILITGGAGYLGTNLAKALAYTACTILRLDRPTATFVPISGIANVENVVGDIHEREIWPRLLNGVDFIFHFGAQTSVYLANSNPLADLDINVLPMLYLLEFCRKSGQRPSILFSGTVTEIGIPSSLPVDESQPDNPITIYDFHKLMAERYLIFYVGEGLAKGTVLRLANVYGPGPRSGSADRGVLNQMIRKALNGERLTIYGQGTHMRDYIFVEDVISAFLIAGSVIDRTNGNKYVIGNGVGYSISQAINLVADRVAKSTGQRTEIQYIEPPNQQSPIEDRNFVADTTVFREDTGWLARWSLSEGIDRTIEWFIGKTEGL